MRIAIFCFDYGKTAITGAGVYYEQLAAILMQHGYEVGVYCMKYPFADHTQQATVYPWRLCHQMSHYDVILCPPDLAQKAATYNRPLIPIVQRDYVPAMPYSSIKGVIFCCEHLQAKYMLPKNTMVWRPMCRLKERTEPRQFKKAIGAVNLANTKGGSHVFELARKYPTWEFIALNQHFNFRSIPDNMTILKWNNDLQFMHDFYDSVGLVYLPYQNEGYNTVALEAVSQHIPIIGHAIPGISEVMRPETDTNLHAWDAKAYSNASKLVALRWQQIRGLNNLQKLLNFIA
jgi:hypothetical protein